jgi:hypothetical protein
MRMKMLIAVALAATSIPAFTTTALARDGASTERRVCTQVTIRAGSRMSGRRICRTPSEWRESLGADWRQHLAGYTGTQDEYDAVAARSPNSWDGTGGIKPDPNAPGARGPDAGGIPH